MSDSEGVLQELGSIRRRAGSAGAQLIFNRAPSGSHAKILVYDCGEGAAGVLGSCNFLSLSGLSEKEEAPGGELSVGTTAASVCCKLFRIVADLWSRQPENRLVASLDRFWNLAERLERESNGRIGNFGDENFVSVRLLSDQEHEMAIHTMLRGATERCIIASHQIGAIAENRLASLSANPMKEKLAIRIVYGTESITTESLRECGAGFMGAWKGVLTRVTDMHAKGIAADETLLVTSYNVLSADPFSTAKNHAEVGMLIEDAALAQRFVDSLHAD